MCRKPFLVSLLVPALALLQAPAMGITTAIVRADGTISLQDESGSLARIAFDQFTPDNKFVTQVEGDTTAIQTQITAVQSKNPQFTHIGNLLNIRRLSSPTDLTNGWTGGVLEGLTKVAQSGTDATVSSNVLAPNGATLSWAGPHLLLDAGAWAGAVVSMDGVQMFTLPWAVGSTVFPSMKGQVLTISTPTKTMTFQFAVPTSIRSQDNRLWVPNFDFRVQDGLSGTWAINELRNYSFTLKTNDSVAPVQASPLVIQQGPDWLPLTPAIDVVPGSILDMSDPKVAPSGSKGWVVSDGLGNFATQQDSTPIRFYGANIQYGCVMPEKQFAPVLAARIAAIGYNAVRFMPFDSWIMQQNATASDQFDPNVQDRMSYFIAELKKRGIYIWMDMLDERVPPAAELDFVGENNDDYKALLLVSDNARNSWAKFAKTTMNTENPYTGLAWKDDPTIAWVCMQNEAYLRGQWNRIHSQTKTLINNAWLASGHTGTFDPTTTAGAAWGASLHAALYNWEKSQLKGIGVKAMLTDINGIHDDNAAKQVWNMCDFVDSHAYWDHPLWLGAPWTLPTTGQEDRRPMLTNSFLSTQASKRQYTKPFTLSELGVSSANAFRADQALIVPAAASMQGWGAIFRFIMIGSTYELSFPGIAKEFNGQDDALTVAVDRFTSQVFRRGDLYDSPNAEIKLMTNNDDPAANLILPDQVGVAVNKLGWSYATGLAVPPTNLPANGIFASPKKTVMFAPQQNQLLLNSAKSSAGVAIPGQSFNSGAMQAKITGSRAVLAMQSRDGQPLVYSKKILLTHMTDLQNSNESYGSQDRQVLTDYGTLPYLVKAGGATVTLTTAYPTYLHVYRLDMAGNRIAQIPVTKGSRSITFSIDNNGPQGATIYYEIGR